MRRDRDFLPVRRNQEWGLSPWSEGSLFSPSSFFGGSPWQTMRRMQEDMDRLFNQMVQPMGQELQQFGQGFAPSVDISQDDREWLIEADFPGVGKDDIDVEVRHGYLTLRAEMRHESELPQRAAGQQGDGQGQGQQGQQQGQQGAARQYHRRERRYGYFERTLPLPQNVDEEHIRCEFRDGVLKVHLPKTEERKPQGRRIPIGEGHDFQPTGQLSQDGAMHPGADMQQTEQQPAGAPGETGAKSGGKSAGTARGKKMTGANGTEQSAGSRAR